MTVVSKLVESFQREKRTAVDWREDGNRGLPGLPGRKLSYGACRETLGLAATLTYAEFHLAVVGTLFKTRHPLTVRCAQTHGGIGQSAAVHVTMAA
jgi:hypothetical protein